MPGATSASRLSLAPLYVEAFGDAKRYGGEDCRLGTGTAFLVGSMNGQSEGFDAFLVTAWHLFTGRHPDSACDENLVEPDYFLVHYPRRGAPTGAVVTQRYDVRAYANESDMAPMPLWVEHPLGPAVDIAVLDIGATPRDAYCLPINIDADCWPTVGGLASDPQWERILPDLPLPLRVTDRVFVVGFPFGDIGTWPFAIWSTAYVASEPSFPHKGRPSFLIDGRTREGQSGAPVFLRYRPGEGVSVTDQLVTFDRDVTVFLGLYSGRTNANSDLGMVWTVEAVRQVVDQAVSRRASGGDSVQS